MINEDIGMVGRGLFLLPEIHKFQSRFSAPIVFNWKDQQKNGPNMSQ